MGGSLASIEIGTYIQIMAKDPPTENVWKVKVCDIEYEDEDDQDENEDDEDENEDEEGDKDERRDMDIVGGGDTSKSRNKHETVSSASNGGLKVKRIKVHYPGKEFIEYSLCRVEYNRNTITIKWVKSKDSGDAIELREGATVE